MVQQIDYHSTKPQDMWKHISQRRPVVIDGIDKVWDKFTDDLMTSKAGDMTVMVERRTSNKESYGQGRKAPMQLAQFIKEVESSNTGLYMSTQEVGVGRDGHPLLYGPPLNQLVGEFPMQQQLMGNLVPQSINMWMGCAPEGSSTGLHHDFHDNLYVLLRGCKRFRLYPPDAAPDMYVRGRVKHIYPNGRIVYEGQGDILPDGSDKHDVHLWQARHAADEAAAAASRDPSHADAADAQLERQLERMLDEGAGFDDFGGLADDYIDSDELADLSEDGSDDDLGDDLAWESDGSAAGVHSHGNTTTKQQRKGLGQQGTHNRPSQLKRQKLAGAPDVAAAAAGRKGSGATIAGRTAGVPRVAEPPPSSFSQVDLSLPPSVLCKRFPRFPGVAACQEVLLQAGQMLYMPAGWFHEVTSFGGGGLDGGHLAINYWYHPPDNLDSSKAGFKHPYTSPYYPTIWAQRQQWLVQDTQQWWEHKQQAVAAASGKGGGKHAAAAPDAVGQSVPQNLRVKTGGTGKHIAWDNRVHSPTNKYRMSMTKQGTATGDAHKSPLGNQTGGPCCGTIGCIEIDKGSESDSPCSSREQSPAKAGDAGKGNHKHKQQQQHASHAQHAPHHADECTLRHVSAASRTNPYAADAEGFGRSKGAAAAAGKSRHHSSAASEVVKQKGVSETQSDDSDDWGSTDDGQQPISKEVQEGISAIEDYFSDNPEAMKALLAEFMQQRRQRMVAASRAAAGGPTMLALPRLFGRRHHHYAAVMMVPRKPARR